jgi:hypothetical protein
MERIKVQADTVHGVYQVENFDYSSILCLAPVYLFKRLFADCKKGETFGTILNPAQYAEVVKEFGVSLIV